MFDFRDIENEARQSLMEFVAAKFAETEMSMRGEKLRNHRYDGKRS